ncbi:MAG: deoxyribodipyrimidine photo-lyase [Gammaproteobacteria bacterium]|nr:deoxyribodipyrimidine photo-lyase [Gammaproteobacteria bacterium]
MSIRNLLWFRQDLRLQDNPALIAAASSGTVLPIYILDDVNAGNWKAGAASRWWLLHSLEALDKALGHRLWVFSGDPLILIPQLVQAQNISGIFWNRCYEPWRIRRDSKLKASLEQSGLEVKSYNGSLLWEPWQNLKGDGTPYRVFTPFYKGSRAKGVEISHFLSKKPALNLALCDQPKEKLDSLNLLPLIPWYSGFPQYFTPGEAGAEDKLERFVQAGLSNYKEGRNFPALESVSRLSPHLHFGEISVHRVWEAATNAGRMNVQESNAEYFQRELVWREFSYSLLFHFPTLTEQNLNPRFNEFPWLKDQHLLQSWQRGETGYPLVDAGMRELWTTGYMHNRVRMVVGSFLVKNLLLHWREGANWFWDCLLDADLPNNTLSWQWVAGCGADAAPYFRIFNPVTQSRKFSAEAYIRQNVPELAKLPDEWIHEPATAPTDVLNTADVVPGKNYPLPVVDLRVSRERALEAYASLKDQQPEQKR